MRMVLGLILSLLMLAPIQAQDTEFPWRDVVTGQIEAFRDSDGAAALELAGASFRTNYQDADQFMRDLERAGYGPIVSSRSHSFGVFRELSEGVVVQQVNLVGPDQRLYEAVYELVDEPGEGWRVRGVVMRQTQGVGI